MCQLSIIDFLNISLFLLSLHIIFICVLLFKLQAIDTFVSFHFSITVKLISMIIVLYRDKLITCI